MGFLDPAAGGLNPFYFYDPFDVLPGAQIGSNFDATGDNTQGRVIGFLPRRLGATAASLRRHTGPTLTLVEVRISSTDRAIAKPHRAHPTRSVASLFPCRRKSGATFPLTSEYSATA